LEEKLEIMANQIGQFGLWAALATTLLMSAAFSWDTFFVAGDAWSWDFLSTYLDFLITGITVLVVAVPEGLPLAVTLALAFSVKQMLREKNLVSGDAWGGKRVGKGRAGHQ
jgi:Ca2+ transporting ATPase